eukprot:CAMPEP_0178903494 /NCGR_PEP_ID=MMETSP0786-20121207/5184_1 /TAXON_ID=186022 /ORGANISM="Thalassionema frauenfeldii, Strain CCMP 1798" /LENGTH=202 /DNA_ID=CAMNT_0020574863 /DNA_START=39 /DNA_END=644 /DNA_ORIENTATION=-
MDSLQEILEKNNEGASHVLNGRFFAAKRSLRTAMMKLQEFSRQTRKSSDVGFQFPSLVVETRTIPQSKTSRDQSSSHFLYRHVLLTFIDPKPSNVQVQKLHDSISDLVGILVFNLSLVYHCNALHHSTRSDLDKVVRIYRKALAALRQDSQYFQIIALAVFNNMGAIYHDLAKYQQAQKCFKAIKKISSSKSSNMLSMQPEA